MGLGREKARALPSKLGDIEKPNLDAMISYSFFIGCPPWAPAGRPKPFYLSSRIYSYYDKKEVDYQP
jgi:hypothetical protein